MFESYDQDIGMLTNKVSKKLTSYLNNKLEKFNITTEQWTVLLKLSKKNKISQKLLAEVSGKDQSTLARILDILERKAFIERHPSKEDRRSFEIHITDSGLNIIGEVSPFLEDLFNKLLKDISLEKLEVYNAVLLKIDKNINSL
ncbi:MULTISPECIES: MarR family winged helix-turn-helix transcriptional regulator [Clostridium]|jgi:transcriptional regulator, MarR family|uniref:MarR family transcriptional regulator n=3 Tax=Clostridium beijerinckii TaxID=1520 RepID=A0AAE2RRP0_CLOBE|nr:MULTISPECIES: MarR family transcriptional regulator [Clostridium]ABR37029.1 transcriptional regulator, MarR family [Clostridium beijerinckii NCIMB 8052]AIU03606.1 MarR family transcriptional regulator [Clostridium beijerinckii ATCC 35702]ALB43947.1 MarR family transcriptional regulator [Clostridium beijerinckii NRRL B-598]MBC2458221.1 MarR family transcriptional regulator [Clostridium beijerinckii]MBC2475481.1 MarR family transcriptional regulator [Clostridium beijerinckii]